MSEIKFYSDVRGQYHVYTEDKKVFTWGFPAAVQLGENFDVVCMLKEKLFEAMQQKVEADKKAKEEKVDVKEEKKEEAKKE